MLREISELLLEFRADTFSTLTIPNDPEAGRPEGGEARVWLLNGSTP